MYNPRAFGNARPPTIRCSSIFAWTGGAFVGRDMDRASSPAVVVNEAFATRYFGREHVVGRTFEARFGDIGDKGVHEVVGVVADTRYDLRTPAAPTVYIQSSVSGTVSGLPNPADVKAGTFDPKTGALKLQLGKKGDSEVLLVLEGTVVKGTATGRVSGDSGTGDFRIAKKKKM